MFRRLVLPGLWSWCECHSYTVPKPMSMCCSLEAVQSSLKKFKVFFSVRCKWPKEDNMSGTPHQSKEPMKLCGWVLKYLQDETASQVALDVVLLDTTDEQAEQQKSKTLEKVKTQLLWRLVYNYKVLAYKKCWVFLRHEGFFFLKIRHVSMYTEVQP